MTSGDWAGEGAGRRGRARQGAKAAKQITASPGNARRPPAFRALPRPLTTAPASGPRRVQERLPRPPPPPPPPPRPRRVRGAPPPPPPLRFSPAPHPGPRGRPGGGGGGEPFL